MIKSEYNLSLSNNNITLNRVDELDHFLNTYYPDKYQEIKNIYRLFNPLFAILTFLSIPIQAFAINANFIIGAITTALTFVILITLYIYSDQKPRQMKKDIFTDIFENFDFLITDVEYPMLAQPVIYKDKQYYYYEFIDKMTNKQKIILSNKILDADIDKSRKPANYKQIMDYLKKL